MTWLDLPAAIRAIAEETLTPLQLQTYKLSVNGMSERDIAVHANVSRRAIRDRLAEADIKIRRHPDYPKQEAA